MGQKCKNSCSEYNSDMWGYIKIKIKVKIK